jgi:hypothetical protein
MRIFTFIAALLFMTEIALFNVHELISAEISNFQSGVGVAKEKIFAAGIKTFPGKRLTLYTDVSEADVAQLPNIFASAFEQYQDYFHISPEKTKFWSMRGCLMKDKSKFAESGLLPNNLPNFENGFSWNYELWIFDQPSDYYRCHLLLHEGVHGFMNTFLGGCGPRWYMEGMAEMLATHRLQNGRLTLNYMPINRDEVPEWGRIKLIRNAVAENRLQSLQTIINGRMNLSKETELYAWSWAAVYFLDHHPKYKDRFREFYKHVLDHKFNDYVFEAYKDDWRQLADEWQVFVAGLEYGYDISRTTIDFSPGKTLSAAGKQTTVATDQGWQNTGIALVAGMKYEIAASGKFQVAKKTNVWWSEPGGVSIRYYQDRPLGVLLAAVRPNDPPLSKIGDGKDEIAATQQPISVFLTPIAIGLGKTIIPDQSGTLFFKINDSAAELDDNAGELKIEIRNK